MKNIKKLLSKLIVEARRMMPPKMEAIWEKVRYKFCRGGRGGGKSDSAIKAVLYICNEKKTRVLCCREIQDSIEDSIYTLICDYIRKLQYNDFKILDKSIVHKNGSNIIFKGLLYEARKQKIKSYSNIDICLVEEAQAVSKGSIDVLYPTIRKPGSEIWFLYNRLEENDPVHVFEQSIPDEEKIVIDINYYDNPFLPEELKKDAARSKKQYENEENDDYPHMWLGHPRNMSDLCIIGLKAVQDAMVREVEDEGQIFVGADIARFGDDRIVFVKRKGLKMIDKKVYKHKSVTQTANLLKEFVNFDKSITIRVDDTGVGGGVTDILKDDFYNVDPINFQEKANDPDKYYNKISELWFEFKKNLHLFQLISSMDLIDELTTRKYLFDNKGRRQVESKKEYKKRFSKSPDEADATLLCFDLSIRKPSFISLGRMT